MPNLWTQMPSDLRFRGRLTMQNGSRIVGSESDSLATFLSEQKGA